MVNLKLIKRWMNMLMGKSTFHVKQEEGKVYDISGDDIKGYYNDLTNKVTSKTIFDENGIPKNKTISGIEAYFPITIFQYALGLYDLYLIEKDDKYIEHFMKIAKWGLDNIENSGMWDCMGKIRR